MKRRAREHCPFKCPEHPYDNMGVLPAALEAPKTPLKSCSSPSITLKLLHQYLSRLLGISSGQEGTMFFSFTALARGLSRVPDIQQVSSHCLLDEWTGQDDFSR